MENIDLNLENYNLKDILNLFKLPYEFTEEELKQAKKIVYQTHPDKSSLPKEYFLFFVKAYKTVYQIFQFRKQKTKSTEYSVDEDREKELLLDQLKDKSNFNKWFNESFEKIKIKEDCDEGYGDWFSSDENTDKRKITMNEMAGVFEEKKRATKEIVVSNSNLDLENTQNQYSLTREKPTYYSSDIFSKLNYDDLKKAHTETVVPVTQEDYENREKFSSVDDLNAYRNNQNTAPNSLEQSKILMRQHKEEQNKVDTERAFNLIKQDEKIEEANKTWWGLIKTIKN